MCLVYFVFHQSNYTKKQEPWAVSSALRSCFFCGRFATAPIPEEVRAFAL
jgi:hypothetical protein